ncbi:hypothetical protein C2G38_2044497 [Gigaspora rosea]|uniref:Uncharacterized protein n=1 Tax=Gigaspora rosea TaxID=44941 RepID=A0A397UG29_9GLOM|nr:hypothetical protein C2G38_2044497 [Gigaspora rosea]
MATIVANPCLTLAIPRNQVLNPKIVDGELIIRNIDKRFIVNLGVPYYKYIKNCIKRKYTNIELLEKLTLHSYDDRLAEKKSERHIKNCILFNFVERGLKGIEGYLDSLQTVYKQEPMQEYFSKFAIPVIADWPGQFYIHKAIQQKALLDNPNIPEFVMAFLPMIGPLHVSLNARELVFKKNAFLFNNIYKSVFGIRKDLGYEITDRHLPRGFVTSKKPNIFAICDSIHCNTPYDLSNGSVLACGHGYHSYCLQNQQFKCFICLDYLQNEIRKNTDALIKSLTKSLGANLSKEDIEEDKGDDKDPNEIHEISDNVMVERQLEDAKKLFFEINKQIN